MLASVEFLGELKPRIFEMLSIMCHYTILFRFVVVVMVLFLFGWFGLDFFLSLFVLGFIFCF